MDSETRRALSNKPSLTAFRRLQAQVTLLGLKLAAVTDGLVAVAAKEQRFATTVTDLVANVAQDIDVTWPQAWPDSGYGVWPTPITGTAATGKVFASLKPLSKTTTTCTITVVATQAVATCGLDVLGVRTIGGS